MSDASGFPLSIVILSIAMLMALALGAWLIYRLIARPGRHMSPPHEQRRHRDAGPPRRGEHSIPDSELPDLWDGKSPWPLEPGERRK